MSRLQASDSSMLQRHPFAHLPACPPPYLRTHPLAHLPTHTPAHLPNPLAHLPTYSPTHPLAHLPTCSPTHTCPPAHLPTCPLVHLRTCQVLNWEPIVYIGLRTWRPTSTYTSEVQGNEQSAHPQKRARERTRDPPPLEQPPLGVGQPLFANNIHVWSFG